ncbi:YfbU family protein [Agarilytica rhodophyticola]|uniref:YfbU family protein n=1 Tax=Agarilytica rhodophyticola TaxID=1737490 RepID=UPI000B347116|nr:YfbU family protein [Agarilytica rhodophyticola]
MKITDGEKLILLMLSELYDTLDVDGEIEPDFIRSAIYSDKTWSIPWKYSGIPFENQETPGIVKEVLDILDMWSFIEYSYGELNDEDRAYVEKEASPFGKDPKFRGFDGNNETDYMGTASFIVNQLDRFEEFKGRNFNSHLPSVDSYRRMLTVFNKMRNNFYLDSLSAEQLVQILKEKVHPENR